MKLFINYTVILIAQICFIYLHSQNIKTENVNCLDSIYSNVDKLPVFHGKPKNISKFIATNIVYPQEAWINFLEGVVKVSFVVTKDGILMNVSVIEGVDPTLDMEAIRVVELMKEWKPALKNKQKVHCRMTVSISFFMSDEEKKFVETLKRYGLDNNMPLYIIDNKIVNTPVFIHDYNLKSLKVIKGEKAVKKYGERAKNGVIEITTKRGTPPIL